MIEPATQHTVIGAAGFVGRHMMRHLEARGLKTYAPKRGSEAVFKRPLGHVFYCAGLTADYLARPFDTVEAHVSYYSRLLRDADFESMTYLSSTRLYDWGDGDGEESVDLPLNPLNPRHLYDFSKGLGEVLGRTCDRANVRVARLACVYADDLDAENFLHRLVQRALAGARVTLETHPANARDYVHVDDVCTALLAIATSGKQPIYNVASGENVRNDALFALLEAETGCRIETTGVGPVAPAPMIDISALRTDLGIVPRRLADALPAMVGRPAARGPGRRRAAS